jgi:hypothetical protein
LLVRVDAPAAHAASEPHDTTVIAYSLDLTHQVVPAATQWSATSRTTPGISGVRSASWIANVHQSRTTLASTALELAARQIAIWHYTSRLPIRHSSVPNSAVRARALELTRGATHGKPPSDVNPVSVGIAATLANVDTDRITMSVLLSINGENSFCNEQKLDIRVNGRWGVVKTGARTELHNAGPGRYKAPQVAALPGQPCRHGRPRDFNEARFTMDRPSEGTSVEIDWNITLTGTNVFQADNGAPSLLVEGGDKPKLQFRQTLPLDPSTFPMARAYLERFLTALLTKLHGILALVVLIILLALAPVVNKLVDAAAHRVAAAVLTRLRSQRTAEPSNKPDAPPPASTAQQQRQKQHDAEDAGS